jgi:hypothetical protein
VFGVAVSVAVEQQPEVHDAHRRHAVLDPADLRRAAFHTPAASAVLTPAASRRDARTFLAAFLGSAGPGQHP